MSLEFDQQLSRLRPPERSEMTDEQYAVFDGAVAQQEAAQGFSNNLFRVLPLNAAQYQGFLQLKASLFNDSCHLADLDKEMIGVVVSSANSCAYCLTSHGDALRGLSGDPVWADQVGYNYRSARLTAQQRALCDYAWFTTRHPDEVDQAQVDALRAAGFDDHQVLEAAFVVGFFNYTNRWVATVGPLANPGHFSHNR